MNREQLMKLLWTHEHTTLRGEDVLPLSDAVEELVGPSRTLEMVRRCCRGSPDTLHPSCALLLNRLLDTK